MSALYLPSVDSTNAWLKANRAALQAPAAVYTTNQTAGRGRLVDGAVRPWTNAPGQALYYSILLCSPLERLAELPLTVSLAVRDVLAARYGVEPQIKWPNDLLLNGKKLVGILCEGAGGQVVCGIGVNLAQPQRFFAQAGLVHATSLAAQGVALDPETEVPFLAEALTRAIPALCEQPFTALRARYAERCVNLGRRVRWDGGSGLAADVDAQGRLVVLDDASGERRLFTGEVSVQGIYGAV